MSGPQAPKPLNRMSLISNEHTYFLKEQNHEDYLCFWVIALAYEDEMVHKTFQCELQGTFVSCSFQGRIAPIDSDPESYMQEHSIKIPLDSVIRSIMWNEDIKEFTQLTYKLQLN